MSDGVFVTRRDDGYTIDTYIRPEPQMYGEMRLKRRPTTVDIRARFIDATKGKSELGMSRLSSQTIASMIVSWDAVDEDNQPVPVTDEAVRDLHPYLFAKLRNIIAMRLKAVTGPSGKA